MLAEPLRPLVPSARETSDEASTRVVEPVLSESQEPPVRRLGLRQTISDLRLSKVTAGGAKAPLVVMALMALFTNWDDQALGILLPEMRAEFAFDLQFLLTLAIVLQVVNLVLAPVMGYIADRASRVWMIRIGAILSNLFSLSTGLAAGIPMLIAGRVGSGLGASITNPAGAPLLADIYPSHTRARIFGFIGVAGAIGLIIGGPVAGVLGETFGWRSALIVLAGLASLISLSSFFIKEPPRGYMDRRELGASVEAAAVQQESVGWSETWRTVSSIATVRRLWYATPFMEVAGTTLLILLGQYFSGVFGASASTRGLIVGIGGAVGVGGLFLSGPVADRIIADKPGRIMKIMGGMLILQSIIVVGLALSPNLWLSVAITLPMTFASALFLPALFSLMTLTVPARVRGLGLQTTAPWRLAGLLMYLSILGLFDSVGLRAGMLALIPLFLIAAVILGTGSSAVDRDIRAAKSASLAQSEVEEARRRGRAKLLVCRDLQVEYDGVQVLFGVDLDVEEGEIVALLGTNGAGKSTLLRAVAGLQHASGGAIFYDGRDITHLPPHQTVEQGVVMVPGGKSILPTLSVADNLDAAAWLFDDAQASDRREKALELFPRLRNRLSDPAGALSGGEQQMLAIAQALVMRPKLLMIDELSLGLAPAVVAELLEVVREINRQGTTVIVVEQSVNIALLIASRAVFMQKGEVRFMGPTQELLDRPDIMKAVFLGKAPSAGAVAPSRVATTERVLTVEEVSVAFGGIHAVDAVSMDLDAGEIVGIIGPNGAGKTTFFDALSGFVPTEGGSILLGAQSIGQLSPDARARLGIGRLFQNSRLFSSMTVRETISVALHQQFGSSGIVSAATWSPKSRKQERKIRRRADELVGLLGLGAYRDKHIGDLSVGTKRVVDIACAMASKPSVLLLDEPSSGLSQAETEELAPVIFRLRKDTGCGMLVIEHDMALITSISDTLVAMDLGKIIVQGSPADVIGDKAVIESYLGTSEEVLSRSGRAKGS